VILSTILLVEDNPHIMKINAEVLSLRGYDVIKTSTAAQAREQLLWHTVNLIVLDIMLPDGNGISLCHEFKERYHIPIIFLTALGDNRDIVEGLRAGGDDYISKPYDLDVLIARIEARLRSDVVNQRYISYGNLKLDTVSLTGYVGNRNILLTQKEFTVLLLLIKNAERKVSQAELVHYVWGVESEEKNQALWTLISRLRKKFNGSETRIEISSLKSGYMLEQL
jgi:DNA-binding response OmpR family regulator